MDARDFVQSLIDEMDSVFKRLSDDQMLDAESDGQKNVATLLELALGSELEAAELAALWLPSTPEVEAKMLFASQCADEMKHYRIIEERLQALGQAPEVPVAAHSPLFQYLKTLRTTAERVAAGPFTCEAIARVRNRQFIAFCKAAGDAETARLYEETIQPEEVHHHEWGRRFLETHVDTPERQELAAAAMRSTLAIADELKTLAERTSGTSNLPVS